MYHLGCIIGTHHASEDHGLPPPEEHDLLATHEWVGFGCSALACSYRMGRLEPVPPEGSVPLDMADLCAGGQFFKGPRREQKSKVIKQNPSDAAMKGAALLLRTPKTPLSKTFDSISKFSHSCIY